MPWLANGVPATVARLGGRLRIDDQARRKASRRMFVATYLLSDVADKDFGSRCLLCLSKVLTFSKPICTIYLDARHDLRSLEFLC